MLLIDPLEKSVVNLSWRKVSPRWRKRERETARGGEAKFKLSLKVNKVTRNRKFPSTTNARRSDGYIKVRKVTQIFDELCGLRERERERESAQESRMGLIR